MRRWAPRPAQPGDLPLARNVELKVRCNADELAAVEGRLADAGHDVAELYQRDTYLHAPHGRLKLREIHAPDGNTAELIAYARPDELGARMSDYRRAPVPVAAAAGLLEALRSALGELVVVEKRRRVAIVGRTRVHLDRVTGLGTFVELETVLAEGDDEAGGHEELRQVVDTLGIGGLAPIAGSYSDLLRDVAWVQDGAPHVRGADGRGGEQP